MTNEPQSAPDPKGALAATSNADKARALIALIENGGGAGAEGIPAARLRDWARDLVETVERAAGPAPSSKPRTKPEPIPKSEAAARPDPRLTASRPAGPRLFTKPPPVLIDRVPPGAVAASATAAPVASSTATPPMATPPKVAPLAAAAQTASARHLFSQFADVSETFRTSASRTAFGAPMPHPPPRQQGAAALRPGILSRQEVDRLVAATIAPAAEPASLGREHPAIVALTLLGEPTLQQAAVLRSLPGRQMRAVHRALRQLEARQV